MNLYDDEYGISHFGEHFGNAILSSTIGIDIHTNNELLSESFPLKLKYNVGGKIRHGILLVFYIFYI